MKPRALRQVFRTELAQLYSESEIDALFRKSGSILLGLETQDIALDEKDLNETEMMAVLGRLKKSEPIQYILEQCEFHGLNLKLDSRVLIPRPETEELVQWILEKEERNDLRIADIGTGSGCIALALKSRRKDWIVQALDLDTSALSLVEENAKLLNLDVIIAPFDALHESIDNIDIIVSNPPYIPDSEMLSMDKNVIGYEPHIALFVDDSDPLLFYKSIILRNKEHCSIFYFEIHEDFGRSLLDWLENGGFEVELKTDMQGKQRMIRAEAYANI